MEFLIEFWRTFWTIATNDAVQTVWLIWLTLCMILEKVDVEKYRGGTVEWVKNDR